MSPTYQNNSLPPHSCLNLPSCPCSRPPRIPHVHLATPPNPPKKDLFQAPEAKDAVTNDTSSKTSNIKSNIISKLFIESEPTLGKDGSRATSTLDRFITSYVLGVIAQFLFCVIGALFPRRKPRVSAILVTSELSNNPTPPTYGVPSASPKPLPELSSLTIHKPNMDLLATCRADTSMPPTPFTALTSDSSYEDQQLHAQWTNTRKVVNSQERSHSILARATVLYNWDGVIPGRKTRGFQAKKGMLVDVCNIMNDEWIMVHAGSCFHIPRSFVCFDKNENSHCQLSAATSGSSPKPSPKLQRPSAPLEYSAIRNILVRRLASRITLLPFRETVLNSLGEIHGKPPVPPAPFPREPSDQDHGGSRVTVSTDCTKLHEGGTKLKFNFTLVPQPHSRFTSLWFNVRLPNGHKIVGTYPERLICGSTHIQQNRALGREVDLSVSGNYLGSGLRLGYKGSRSQEAEYLRTTTCEVRGAGLCSDNATWVAAEDLAAGAGLGHKLKFSIMLPSEVLPSSVKCHYKIQVAKQRSIEAKGKISNFNHRWKVEFTPEAFDCS